MKFAEKGWLVIFGISIVMNEVGMGRVFTLYKGDFEGINVIKTLSGMCLGYMVCITIMRIKLCSKIMIYIGERPLYFYLVHINLFSILERIEWIDGIMRFYMVLILMFPITEFFIECI